MLKKFLQYETQTLEDANSQGKKNEPQAQFAWFDPSLQMVFFIFPNGGDMLV